MLKSYKLKLIKSKILIVIYCNKYFTNFLKFSTLPSHLAGKQDSKKAFKYSFLPFVLAIIYVTLFLHIFKE